MTAAWFFAIALGIAAPPIASKEPTRPTGEPHTLDELVNAYRWYGLPLLPKAYHVVRWEEKEGRIDPMSRKREEETSVHLGILVERPDATKIAEVWERDWTGPERRENRLVPVKPTPACLDGLKYWSAEDYISLAVHCHINGWDELAGAALDKARTEARNGEYPPELSTPEERKIHVINTLRKMAWGRAYYSLFEPELDRKKALDVMQRVYSENDPVYIRGEYSDDLIVDLRATLRPVSSPSGSIEQLIDGLTKTKFGPDLTYFGLGRYAELHESDPIVKLAERGFDAVPSVIAHLKDNRLTRSHLSLGINNGVSSGLARVRQSCAAYLMKLSDREIVERKPGVLSDSKFFEIDDAFIASCSAWYERSRLVGEEKWAMDHVAPNGKYRNEYNPLLLRLIRAKYPNRLPGIYRAALGNKKYCDSEDLAANLALSRLDRDTKFSLLRQGVAHAHPGHRLAAVQALSLLDRSEHIVAVKDALSSTRTMKEELFKQTKTLYYLTEMVLEANEPRCWSAYRGFLQTTSSDRRNDFVQLLVDEAARNSPGFRTAASIGMAYFEDTYIPAVGQLPNISRIADLDYVNLSLGNYCALRLAEVLDIDLPWNPDRTPAEWAALRKMVKAAVEKELAAGKK